MEPFARQVRNAAADALGQLLGRSDREPKMRVVGFMFDNGGPQVSEAARCPPPPPPPPFVLIGHAVSFTPY